MHRSIGWTLVFLAAVAQLSPAAEGYYDTSFAGTGHEVVDITAGTNDKGLILRIAPGGNLLMAGTCASGGTAYFCATQLDAAGAKVLTFGPDNTGTITFDRFFAQGISTSDQLLDMLVLSDGRILFLGFGGTLAMLNAGGTALDTGSGGGTGYTNAFGNYALAEQPDHKILAVGNAPRGDGNYDMSVQRFLSDLSPDTDFGTNGIQRIELNLGMSNSLATSVAVQANGDIVVAGYVIFTGQSGRTAVIARMSSTGQPDSGFGGSGSVYQTAYGTQNVATSVRIDQRGRIVYGGYGATDSTFSTRRCVINRLLANGNQDFTFNSNQAQTFTVLIGANNIPCEIFDVAPQPDGTILGVGSLLDTYFTAARLKPDGTFDSTFGASGKSVGAFDSTYPNSIVRSGSTAIGNGLLVGGTAIGGDTRFGVAQIQVIVRVFANGFDY